jgi:hypothetical protein
VVRKTTIVLASLAVLGLVLYFSGFTEGFMMAFEGHAGLPSCGSSHGQSDAKRAIENGPTAKTTGVAVIAISDTKTISANAQKVECAATAILNSAQKAPMIYSFTSDPSLGSRSYLVRAKVDLESIKPYP